MASRRPSENFTCVEISAGVPAERGSFSTSSRCDCVRPPAVILTVYVPGGASGGA